MRSLHAHELAWSLTAGVLVLMLIGNIWVAYVVVIIVVLMLARRS